MIRTLFSATILLILSHAAHAEVTAALGTSVMFESSSNGRSYDQRQPMAVRGGYRFESYDAYAEFSRLEVTSGTSYVDVKRKRDQLLAWARVSKREWKIAPFVAAGAGFLNETVGTRLGADERLDSSGAQPVLAAAAGGVTPISQWLELSLELRIESSKVYAPHPLMGLGLFASAKF